MYYCILILFICVVLNECRESYRLHKVNMSEGVRMMSMIGKKINHGYIFKLISESREINAVSNGIFIEQINMTGWGHLLIKSSQEYPDELQAYFAGVVEGVISRPLISAHWANTYQGYCSKPTLYCSKLSTYLRENFVSLVHKTRNSSEFLKMVRLQLWQIKGMQDGYDDKWMRNSSEINENYLLKMKDQLFELYLLQIDGDLYALSQIFGGLDYHHRFTDKGSMADMRCSAFVKYIKGSIYSSHVTWHGYNTMLRITKLYDFPYRENENGKSSHIIAGRKLSFSSYPAVIVSLDDFYITSAGLVTMETTISNFNASLWESLKSTAGEVILEYARVLSANRMAKSGLEWSKLFATNNSGTYNNQWMIVDHNVMKNHHYGERIPDGALYVAEQIPNLVAYEDVTEHLRTPSYWSSYNLPYNKIIWQMGNFQSQVDKYGDLCDYDKSPRALMFKRNGTDVVDEVSLMRLMRYNDFKNDPLSKCACNPPYSAFNAISARCDLNLKNGTYPLNYFEYSLMGGIDMKYTTSSMAQIMRFVGINGPTYDQQPVFDWDKITGNRKKHIMHPKRFQFPPVLTPFS